MAPNSTTTSRQKTKTLKPNTSSYPNNIPLKNKYKFSDLPLFASVTNGIAKPIVNTSSTKANIRALVFDDQDLINEEGLQNANSHVGAIWYGFQLSSSSSADNFQINASIKSTYSCIKTATSSFTLDELMIWIDVCGLSLCALESNAYKKVADRFGKFMFFEAKESMEMSSGRICISTKSHNFVSEKVLFEVHGVNYDVYVHELGTWNINIVDETLHSSDNIYVNGMEKVEDSVDENSLADLNDLNDLKETINELESNKIQHPISKENID
ncbi:hypothetical protein Tco_1533909 [Tanacetum coccineum]